MNANDMVNDFLSIGELNIEEAIECSIKCAMYLKDDVLLNDLTDMLLDSYSKNKLIKKLQNKPNNDIVQFKLWM